MNEPVNQREQEPAGADPTDGIGDLDEHDNVPLAPETAVTDSLHAALKQLRSDADGLEKLSGEGDRVDAAEQLAEDAATIDEQIGSIARADES